MVETGTYDELFKKVKKLEKHLESYRTLVENTQDLLYRTDPEGRISYISPSVYRLSGYTVEEAMGMYMAEEVYFNPEERKDFLVKLRNEGQVANFEARLKRKDGSIWWASTNAHVYKDRGGNILGVEGIARDITERKRAEEALREKEERLRSITDSALDAIFCKDMNRRTTFVNPAMLQLMGCTEADLIGKTPEEVHNQENAVIVNEVDERTLNGEKVNEIRSLSIAGKTYTLQTIQVPLRDADGNITGISGIVRDVTDFVQAQEALRVSKAKYETIFNLVPVGIAVSDNAGNIVENNRIGEKMLGLSRKEYLKRSIDSREWHIIKQDGSPMSTGEFASTQALKENRLVENVEMGIVKGTGETTWINVNATPIPIEDYGVAIAYMDITNRKKAEEQLQESLDEKVLLLSEIHHRVKNNLQVISSLMDLTRRRTLNEEAKTVLADARSKIYAMSLVHSQLYRSKSFNRIDMAVHARRLLDSMRQIYTNSYRRVRPRLECSKVFLSVTQAIPCALVMNELISNVYKHAYPEDATGDCLISMAEKDGKWIHFRVKDDGVGIPDDIDIESNETLGLKLIRNLVRKQLKGEVRFKRDNGTDITAEFPINHDDLLIH